MINDLENLSNKEKSMLIRNKFKIWKQNSLDSAGYFIIFQGFVEEGILNKISGNALKLYIYMGTYSNNYEGIVWHSNKKIANYFGKSERTIRTWMKELEDLNLIHRMRLKYDGEVYTHLLSYPANTSTTRYNDTPIEGILYFNDIGKLCFQGNSKSFVIYSNISHIKILIHGLGMFSGPLSIIQSDNNIGFSSAKNSRNTSYDEFYFRDSERSYALNLSYKKDYDKIIPAIIVNF